MLEVQALSFDYQDKPLLQDVGWTLSPGKLLHLQGGNGVGKTTFLRLVAGILRPESGDILWENRSIYGDLPAFQRNICYVGHKMGLRLELTVRENCFFDAHWQRKSNVDFQILTQAFGLDHMVDVPCFQLSEGQRRRTALMRLAMSDARLWLLDEPFVALDSQSLESLCNYLLKHLAEAGMIVMTSHQELPALFQSYESYCL
jgi:heme exporter protein A